MTHNELILACSAYAEEHGTEEMLDVIAGVHRAFTERTPKHSAPRIAYELAGVELDENTPKFN